MLKSSAVVQNHGANAGRKEGDADALSFEAKRHALGATGRQVRLDGAHWHAICAGDHTDCFRPWQLQGQIFFATVAIVARSAVGT
jgi:hypothetical protein